jgi:hypothetical protein
VRGFAVVLLAFLTAVPLSVASAQDPDPDEFTPPGYEFCGWRDPERGGWAMEWDDRLAGACTVLFARRMSCRAARTNYRRLRYTRTPPYEPRRAGYRCEELRSGYEFTDVRCAKRGRPRVAFRYQSGA